jgi:hypothetical protein
MKKRQSKGSDDLMVCGRNQSCSARLIWITNSGMSSEQKTEVSLLAYRSNNGGNGLEASLDSRDILERTLFHAIGLHHIRYTCFNIARGSNYLGKIIDIRVTNYIFTSEDTFIINKFCDHTIPCKNA